MPDFGVILGQGGRLIKKSERVQKRNTRGAGISHCFWSKYPLEAKFTEEIPAGWLSHHPTPKMGLVLVLLGWVCRKGAKSKAVGSRPPSLPLKERPQCPLVSLLPV